MSRYLAHSESKICCLQFILIVAILHSLNAAKVIINSCTQYASFECHQLAYGAVSKRESSSIKSLGFGGVRKGESTLPTPTDVENLLLSDARKVMGTSMRYKVDLLRKKSLNNKYRREGSMEKLGEASSLRHFAASLRYEDPKDGVIGKRSLFNKYSKEVSTENNLGLNPASNIEIVTKEVTKRLKKCWKSSTKYCKKNHPEKKNQDECLKKRKRQCKKIREEKTGKIGLPRGGSSS